MIIALDFDGTLATHLWPNIGEDIGAFKWLLPLQEEHKDIRYILWTVRTYHPLADAVEYCTEHGLSFWAVNENPNQRIWSSSPKAHAHAYVDDTAVGAPLIHRSAASKARPYVDWTLMGPLLRIKVNEYFAMKSKTGFAIDE